MTHWINLITYLSALPEQGQHTGLQDHHLLIKYNQLFSLSFIRLAHSELVSAHLMHCIVNTGGALDRFYDDNVFTILKFNWCLSWVAVDIYQACFTSLSAVWCRIPPTPSESLIQNKRKIFTFTSRCSISKIWNERSWRMTWLQHLVVRLWRATCSCC